MDETMKMRRGRVVFGWLASVLLVMTVFGCSGQYVAPTSKPAVSRTTLLNTTWRAAEINGSRVVFSPGQILDFSLVLQNGRLSGSTGCNNITGSFTRNAFQLNFSSLAVTRRACSPALMARERAFIEALRSTGTYTISQGRLRFFNKEGGEVMEFIALKGH